MAVKDIVQGEIFIFIARAAIILGTSVGFPLAGWLLERAVSSIDSVAQVAQQHTVQLDHIQTTVMDHVDALNRTVGDHEQRIRSLEQRR